MASGGSTPTEDLAEGRVARETSSWQRAACWHCQEKNLRDFSAAHGNSV